MDAKTHTTLVQIVELQLGNQAMMDEGNFLIKDKARFLIYFKIFLQMSLDLIKVFIDYILIVKILYKVMNVMKFKVMDIKRLKGNQSMLKFPHKFK